MYEGHRVIDGHVHYCLDIEPEYFTKLLDRTGTDMANLAVITHGGRVSCDTEALALKAMYPGRFYVCGSLDPCLYYRGGEDMGALQAEHARRLMKCGCDGIKLLEGKPQLRRALPIPDFDARCWDAFWDYAEGEQIPVLWHVNDPENFWDESAVPVWARTQGWFYDSSYINNEEQYRQVLAVLERHPRLRICFAHMFFMSARLPRLREIMERYENLRVDLTPGIELYENLSKAPEEARRFFEDFHDRIIYGTDIGSRFVYNPAGKPFNERENLRRPEIVRDYLCKSGAETIASDGDFLVGRPDFEMRCLGLEGSRADEILCLNFLRFMGGEPKPVDTGAALEECGRIRRRLESASRLPGFLPDCRGVELAEKYLGDLAKQPKITQKNCCNYQKPVL